MTTASLARAQTVSAVIPTGTEAVDASSTEPFILGGFEGKTMLIIDRAKLGPLASRAIKRLILRRDAQTNEAFPLGMKGGWIDLEIKASWTSQAPTTPDPRFAANHSRPTTVFAGEYRVIDSPKLPSNTKGASFGASVSAHIVLATPILPSTTGNLCLELTYKRHATKPVPPVWLVDMHREPPSSLVHFGPSCWRKNHLDPLSADLDPSTAVGGTLRCTTHGPLTPMAVLIIGSSATQWGPLRLPFDLSPYGAPGCRLHVSWDLLMATATRVIPAMRDAHAQADIPTPHDAKLAGARLYSQWLFFDPTANALSMTMTNGVSVALAPTPPNLGVGMVQAQSPNAAAGRVYVNRSPVLRFEDR